MIGLVEYSKRHQICGHNGRSEGQHVWLWAWAAGFLHQREESGEGTPRPCGFSLGVHGVCLTKNFILYYDL